MTSSIPTLPSGEPIYKCAKVEMETNTHPITSFSGSNGNGSNDEAYVLGDTIVEGKTKIVYNISSQTLGRCLVVSKDIITAGDGAKRDVMEGKAALSTSTNGALMQILNEAGIKTSFIKKVNETSYLAWKCHMIPIEWVIRRVATGSFLKRNTGVPEGYTFYPPKLETFFKDDENHDPQWSREALEEAKLTLGKTILTPTLIDVIERMSVVIFEILERCWKTKNVTLVDMKLEFGIREDTGEVCLSDVIDNDSWRIWPNGDKRLMRDKQVYRNMDQLTDDGMMNLKKNYKWVADSVTDIWKSLSKSSSRVMIFMGSSSDLKHCEAIRSYCEKLGISSHFHISSAHKSTSAVLKLVAKLESQSLVCPTVIIAVAGRSNGLGPVLSGNTNLPVINCPPISGQFGTQDIWSSLRLPSGLGCSTVLTTDAAAQSAAQILCQHDLKIWLKLRAKQLDIWTDLVMSDEKIQSSQ